MALKEKKTELTGRFKTHESGKCAIPVHLITEVVKFAYRKAVLTVVILGLCLFMVGCPVNNAGNGGDDDGWLDLCQFGFCSPNAACVDLTGSFACTCKQGFAGNGFFCTDLDACASSPCFDGVTCTDLPPPSTGFTCGDCPAGMWGDGIACSNCPFGFWEQDADCVDVDECIDGTHDCPDDSLCENLCGGFNCKLDCNGVAYDDPLVCSGRGNCNTDGVCECDSLYTGDDCECDIGWYTEDPDFPCGAEYYCNGIWGGDPLVCSGFGKCVAEDVCECEYGREGQFCENVISYHSCYGIAYDDPMVCSARGECVAQDDCQCDSGWGGDDCGDEILVYCFGFWAFEPDVCNMFGDCIAPDICECEDGHDGLMCENYCGTSCRPSPCHTCNGLECDNPLICSGNGTCVWTDDCECDPGWGGQLCDYLFTCYGVDGDDPQVCSGQGECIGDDVCLCDPGYGGDCSGLCSSPP